MTATEPAKKHLVLVVDDFAELPDALRALNIL